MYLVPCLANSHTFFASHPAGNCSGLGSFLPPPSGATHLYGVLVAALQTGPFLLKQPSSLPEQPTMKVMKQRVTDSVRSCDICKEGLKGVTVTCAVHDYDSCVIYFLFLLQKKYAGS